MRPFLQKISYGITAILGFFLVLGCAPRSAPLVVLTTPTETFKMLFKSQKDLAQYYLDEEPSNSEWTLRNRSMLKSFMTPKGREKFENLSPEVIPKDEPVQDPGGTLKALMKAAAEKELLEMSEEIDGPKAVVTAAIKTFNPFENNGNIVRETFHLELKDGLWYMAPENFLPKTLR